MLVEINFQMFTGPKSGSTEDVCVIPSNINLYTFLCQLVMVEQLKIGVLILV